MTVRLSIGNDHGGYNLAMYLLKELKSSCGTIFYHGAFSKNNPVDYPDYARCVGNDVISSRSEIGILICRTGAGMCLAANKINGIRAVNCWNVEIAQLARSHNNANVLCLGADFVDAKNASDIVDVFLQTKFDPRHSKRLEKVMVLESMKCVPGKM
ncbi:MAG: RpiB/LacA/LacB family sugar-phosphate isomerase [Puniceicoccales bacterium]|jgi:RpiB/LacA/LacB family sugar-phosphate isomerase|nr:RpiB/LacA/LacB family sugar-phosphate isomerase [Puniceicoccales bacterium]